MCIRDRSCAGQHGVQQRVVRFAQALAGRVERAALEAFPECRAGLDGEVVGRQVRHVERQKVVQRPPPLLDGQLRQTVDPVSYTHLPVDSGVERTE